MTFEGNARDPSDRLNCALEAVKNVSRSSSKHFGAIIITTDFTLAHWISPSLQVDSRMLLVVRIRAMPEIGGEFRLTPQLGIRRQLINDASGVHWRPFDAV